MLHAMQSTLLQGVECTAPSSQPVVLQEVRLHPVSSWWCLQAVGVAAEMDDDLQEALHANAIFGAACGMSCSAGQSAAVSYAARLHIALPRPAYASYARAQARLRLLPTRSSRVTSARVLWCGQLHTTRPLQSFCQACITSRQPLVAQASCRSTSERA